MPKEILTYGIQKEVRSDPWGLIGRREKVGQFAEGRLNYRALIPLAEHFSSPDLSVHLEFDTWDPVENLYLNQSNLSRLAKLGGINRLEVVNGDSQDRTYRLTYQDGQTTAQVYVDIDGIRRAIRLDERWGQGKESPVFNPDPWKYYLDNKIKTQGVVRAGSANLLRASQEEIGIRLILTTKGTDHEWESSIYNRIIGKGCPVCQGLKVVLSNSLFTTHLKIAKDWHPTKNESLSPKEVVAASMKKVWWQCPTVKEHEWKAIIDNRTRKGYGCPECGIKLDISQKKLFEIVKKIFIDREVIYKYRSQWLERMELDIFVPVHNLGFEYQGLQHSKPTPFFGGEKAYVAQIARDKLKSKLCSENDITLIHVYYTDRLDEASIRNKIIKTGLYFRPKEKVAENYEAYRE